MPGCVALTDLVAGQLRDHANRVGITRPHITPLPQRLGGQLFVQAVVPDGRAGQTLGSTMNGALELVIGTRGPAAAGHSRASDALEQHHVVRRPSSTEPY